MRNVFYSFIVSFFAMCFISQAQTTLEFTALDGKFMSSPSIVYDIDQDDLGNIWIASEEGVLKHNSVDFENYTPYSGMSGDLSNRVTSLLISDEQQVLIGTDNGAAIYIEDENRFQRLKVQNNDRFNIVKKIVSGDGYALLAGYQGIYKWKKESNELIKFIDIVDVEDILVMDDFLYVIIKNQLMVFDLETKKALADFTLSNNARFSSIEKVNNAVAAGTNDGELFQVQFNTGLSVLSLGNYGSMIRDVVAAPGGGFYLATDGRGIIRLDNNYKIQKIYQDNDDDSSSLSSNGIYDLLIDNAENLWVATYGGGVVTTARGNKIFTSIQHQFNDDQSLKTNFTRALLTDKFGKIWFGTKKGLSIWDRSKDSWRHIDYLKNSESRESTIVLSLEEQDDWVYVGTFNQGLFKIHTSSYTIEPLPLLNSSDGRAPKTYALTSTADGSLWAGNLNMPMLRIQGDKIMQTYPLTNIKSIVAYDSDIYVTGRTGLHKVNTITSKIDSFKKIANGNGKWNYTSLNNTAFWRDKIFIATNGSGILIYDQKTQEVDAITTADGLGSNIAQSILKSENGEFWAGTTNGISHIIIDGSETLVYNYDQSDGLASNEFNYGSYTTTGQGEFLFGGTKGVVLFHPKDAVTQAKTPNLIFDQLKISNEVIAPGEAPLTQGINRTKQLQLDDDQNALEISFVGILHGSQEQVKYSYYLDGFDKKWSDTTRQNFATYTNLNPDKYTFRVKAFNKYGQSSEEQTIRFNIDKPWWSTNLAIVCYLLLLVVLGYVVYHFIRILVRKRNADQQIDFFNNITHEIKTPLAVLMSSLDSVTNELEEKDQSKKRIKRTVERINSLFEQLLNFHKVTSQNSIEQHLKQFIIKDHIAALLEDFKPMMNERELNLSYTTALDEELFHHDRDVMDKVIRNIISNSIKYSNAGGVIDVHLSNTSKMDLQVEIADQGIGIPQEQQKFILHNYYRARNAVNSQRPGTGLGLVMVKKLIEKTGGAIAFESEENVGTKFTIVLKDYKEAYLEKESLKNTIIKEDVLIDSEIQGELTEFSNAKILVVEDNDELRTLMVNNLSTYFQVYDAANGKLGLEIAHQVFPDLILTDLIMPEMDGMEMSKLMKEDVSLNHIPIFMLTVLQNSTQKLDSLKSGISEYIEKPVNYKLMLAKIVNTLKYQRQLRKRFTKEKDTNNAAIFKNQIDKEFLEELDKNIQNNLGNDEFTVHDLSASMGMSRTSLYMKLKNLVDLSPQDYIINTKLKLAKKLLIESDLSIKEVAFQSGFSNPKYFSTSFKKFYGMTPSGFLGSINK
ncbi:His Kinase A (phospho-acceptor) domain-containing protein [Nonlabens sp. Hel1_33_55]|uniref:hybrid sensor histidine kinase/response regulator transcription factor n=1 Tax=Nonlabens sp. Hel1_33_55 TaxID=1336802 RepID=UPI000875B0A1|nr:ATP-binding protein [Nonlabens sp. Hel1_33_55]SCX99568.1 His Kinase A (phospho-acceptor) domain-containing protein [Nonlabens sp. Hel1_33_55]